MRVSKFLAVVAGAAVVGSVLVVSDAASADVKTFTNQIVTDPHIRTVTLEVTPKTLSVSLTIDNLQFQPTLFSFYLMPADTVANAPGTPERVFRATNPDEPGAEWGIGGYIRPTSGADLPGPATGSFTVATSGNVSTASLVISDPVALPWSGPTWIAVTFAKPGTTYSSGVVAADGLHGFGPVNDLSIPTAVTLAISRPTQISGTTSTTVSGSVLPAASGTVEIFDGATSVGTVSTTEAMSAFAVPIPTTLAVRKHTLHAVFTPTTSRFAIGSSASVTLRVLAATKTTVKLSRSQQRFKHTRVTARVTVSGKHAGKVRLFDGKHKVKTLTLHRGTATYRFSATLATRRHVITAVYLPKNATTFARSTSAKKVLTVVK
ncbi:hypothetical protein BH11ACT2_BH11ACT2_00960 [soil metagenome]